MLSQNRRHWNNVKTALCQCVHPAGMAISNVKKHLCSEKYILQMTSLNKYVYYLYYK